MKHASFAMGEEFSMSTGQVWRCTDIGSRTITAIELVDGRDPGWYAGPPYAVREVVFDELDYPSCFRSVGEAIADSLIDSGHPGYSMKTAREMMAASRATIEAGYPNRRLLRGDRVLANGDIAHPCGATLVAGVWDITVCMPVSARFATIPESEFVTLRPATKDDWLRLKTETSGNGEA